MPFFCAQNISTDLLIMADFRVRRVEQTHTKIRSIPIAVTPEGFWCCPSPVVFQKTLKPQQNPPNTPKPPPQSQKTAIQKAPIQPNDKKPDPAPSRSRVVSHDQRSLKSNNTGLNPSLGAERSPKRNADNFQRKVAVEFGDSETSDLKVILFGKQGFAVKMSVHKDVLVGQSKFFADKLTDESQKSSVEISDCEDVEIYVETVGLMYCKEMKQRLIKQSVSRVLRILKDVKLFFECGRRQKKSFFEESSHNTFRSVNRNHVCMGWLEGTITPTEEAEILGFPTCIQSCLEYLEAAPWVGEEEEKVVSSILRLQTDSKGISPVLKRVSSEIPNPPNDTLTQILDLVLKSSEERGRRDMKSLVLKLLRENNVLNNGITDIYNDNIYQSSENCIESLLLLFRQAAEPGFTDKSMDSKGPVVRQIALEADNLLWLLEILVDRQTTDKFTEMWGQQEELATFHSQLPIVSRHLISCITARLFVGIGRGEMLPSKETRHKLLQTWLQPLIDDYSWLQHGCRSFDKKLVEEGIGRTILTLPLEEQQNILLSWMGNFLKVGDNCPNLQRAFEVWWRRTFIRPYVEPGNPVRSSDSGMTQT